MRILLIRHGESQGNVDKSAYIKGDVNIELTETGWIQAQAAGEFLSNYYPREQVNQWPLVYLSSYRRPKETFSGIMHGMGQVFDGEPKLYEDPRLIEKYFGLRPKEEVKHAKLDHTIPDQLQHFFNHHLHADPFVARPLFGESNKDLYVAVKQFTEGTLYRHIREGHDEIMIVGHGAWIKTFIMNWAHLQLGDRNKLKINNTDVISLTGGASNWQFIRIWDGKAQKESNDNMLEGLERFSVRHLPSVPDWLKQGL